MYAYNWENLSAPHHRWRPPSVSIITAQSQSPGLGPKTGYYYLILLKPKPGAWANRDYYYFRLLKPKPQAGANRSYYCFILSKVNPEAGAIKKISLFQITKANNIHGIYAKGEGQKIRLPHFVLGFGLIRATIWYFSLFKSNLGSQMGWSTYKKSYPGW